MPQKRLCRKEETALWEDHKTELHFWYMAQEKPMKEVIRIMAEKHDFHRGYFTFPDS